MTGAELTQDWLDSDPTAMTEPIVIEEPDGLGMAMPPSSLTVPEIATTLGHETPLEVIGSFLVLLTELVKPTNNAYADVATQSSLVGWTLGKWATYYSCEPSAREKVRNVISLEISGTKLGDQVLPPKLVRDIDWVEKFWPNNKKGASQPYPKVQLYCLMGVAGAWTVSVYRSIAFSLLTVVLGLAHRLCWVVCVLSHTKRIEGIPFVVFSSYSR